MGETLKLRFSAVSAKAVLRLNANKIPPVKEPVHKRGKDEGHGSGYFQFVLNLGDLWPMNSRALMV